MEKQNDLLMDSSILYRSTQKYYDKMLQDLNLSYAQLPILIEIYENEGISSNKSYRLVDMTRVQSQKCSKIEYFGLCFHLNKCQR